MKKSFEDFLVWTSLRYCIGRHSYVNSYADDYAQVYNDFNKEERKKFAVDIRRQIDEQLRFLPFSLKIEPTQNYYWFDPIDALFGFVRSEQINSFNELAKYKEIIYNANECIYKTRISSEGKNPTIYASEIDDLLCWDRLANLFDEDKHRMLTLTDGSNLEAFPYWTRDLEQVGDNLYKNKEFGWHIEYKPLKEFLKGNKRLTIPYSSIKKIEEL